MNAGPLIEPDQIPTLIDPVILDVRWYLDGRDGYASYLQGHYSGAVFVDLDTVATEPAPPTAGRHPLPPPATFVRSIAELGVGPTSQVLIMDDARGSIAARIWWMLDVLGIEAYVLLGGVQSLPEADICLTPCHATPKAPWTLSINEWPENRVVNTDEIESQSSRFLLLDARSQERYLGDEEPIDRVGGHIPGARSLPWQRVLDTIEGSSVDSSRAEISNICDDERELVAYCGSGVTACTLVLALRAYGREAKLYPASYSGWSSDPSHIVCTDICDD
ncbi:sulfurtransferase [Ferrimicrobium acidiphilum]|jgi:thiosulfate/3-mercaptopyruvate sulfurtransferase|uniref:sulfurtransferase n=1 Tax=Ferrimicrobium acidiphilum TaxID=121039 RepID=UPI0023F31EFE|nr:rhodanese-like domain-containing protein [Ferrimicrobium acidiphilum]